MQYSSLKYSDRLYDVNRWRRPHVTVAQRKVAHFAFDTAQVASATAGGDSLLQNLLEHSLMKRFALQRGE